MRSEEFVQRAFYLHEGAIPSAEQSERWCDRVARGNRTLFEKRLAWGVATRPPDLEWGRPFDPQLSAPDFISLQAYEQLDEWLAKRLMTLDKSQPIGARLAAAWTQYWIEAIGLFFERLRADRDAIQSIFGVGKFVVEIVEPGMSDHHHRGQTVIAVQFVSGVRVVYKPKSLESDFALGQVLTWCNGKGLSQPLKTFRILPRDGYGWMEYFGCEEGTTTNTTSTMLARRAGILMALLYSLRATDCHRYNVLNDGDDIALVDAETLMHPDARPFTIEPSRHPFYDSVYRMGMLTRWEGELDMGALAEVPTEAAGVVIAGFEEMYRLLLENRDEFLASEGLQRFKKLPVRFIFRATKIYDAILRQTLQPQCLENGIERSIVIDQLSRAFLVADEKPYAWPLLEVETEAIAVGDIPYFATARDSVALTVGVREPIADYFKKSGYDRCVEQILAFSEAALAFQKSIIDLSFRCRPGQATAGMAKSTGKPIAQIPRLTSDDFLEEAWDIGWEIHSNTVRAKDGSAHWIMPVVLPPSSRFQLRPVGDDLYSGRCGIALFLAALHKATADSRHRELSLAAISGVRGQHLGIGGMTGLGSIVYAMARMSGFLGMPRLLDDASIFAELITEQKIQSDTRFDVMSGAAGAILGLLTLPALLDQAVECGWHISRSYAPTLTGFAHGAAGVAHAMLRLFERTNEIEFKKTAERAIAFERKMFSKEQGNWPDLRSTPPEFPVRWCHGAAGIGLARIESGYLLDDPEIPGEIEAAIRLVKNRADHVDHLCCGNAGHIETLLVAGLTAADDGMNRVLLRKRELGGYTLNTDLRPGTMVPGLFQGLAGVGYELLRLWKPEQFPSVLLMN